MTNTLHCYDDYRIAFEQILNDPELAMLDRVGFTATLDRLLELLGDLQNFQHNCDHHWVIQPNSAIVVCDTCGLEKSSETSDTQAG